MISTWECVPHNKIHSIAMATPLKMEAEMHIGNRFTIFVNGPQLLHDNIHFVSYILLDNCKRVLEDSKTCKPFCTLVIRNGISQLPQLFLFCVQVYAMSYFYLWSQNFGQYMKQNFEIAYICKLFTMY